MPDSTLDIVITATDRASGELKQINRELGGMEDTVKKSERSGGMFSRLLGGLGGLATGAAIGSIAAIGGAFVASVRAGADAEEMMSKFGVVFANTSDQVTGKLTEFANAAGRNKLELMEMASTLGDTLKPMGFAEEATAGLSVDLVKLATDLSSFNNMPMDEALRRLQGTLIGSHENALAFGVIINENTLKAELAANGWDELTGAQLEQAKVQARINLLMKGTTDAQGDAIRTSDSWTNQMRALTSRLSEAAATIGLRLLPVITPLLSKLVDLAVDITPLVVAWIDRTIQVMGEWWQFIDTNLMPVLRPLLTLIKDIASLGFQGLAWMLNNVTLPALRAVWSFIDGFVIRTFGSWAGAIDAVVQKIQGLINWVGGVSSALSNLRLPSWLGGGGNVNVNSAPANVGGGSTNNFSVTVNATNTDPSTIQRSTLFGVQDALLATGR